VALAVWTDPIGATRGSGFATGEPVGLVAVAICQEAEGRRVVPNLDISAEAEPAAELTSAAGIGS
jgi:hypothetical protein